MFTQSTRAGVGVGVGVSGGGVLSRTPRVMLFFGNHSQARLIVEEAFLIDITGICT